MESKKAETAARWRRIALRQELARLRVDHARAVARVQKLEDAPLSLLGDVGAAMSGDFLRGQYLEFARVRRDAAWVAMRHLEYELGTEKVNDA